MYSVAKDDSFGLDPTMAPPHRHASQRVDGSSQTHQLSVNPKSPAVAVRRTSLIKIPQPVPPPHPVQLAPAQSPEHDRLISQTPRRLCTPATLIASSKQLQPVLVVMAARSCFHPVTATPAPDQSFRRFRNLRHSRDSHQPVDCSNSHLLSTKQRPRQDSHRSCCHFRWATDLERPSPQVPAQAAAPTATATLVDSAALNSPPLATATDMNASSTRRN